MEACDLLNANQTPKAGKQITKLHISLASRLLKIIKSQNLINQYKNH